LVFEARLMTLEQTYREFILAENALISGLFVGLAVALFYGRGRQRSLALRINAVFWALFCVAVLLFPPEASTLDMVRDWLPVRQSSTLQLTGALNLIATVWALWLAETPAKQHGRPRLENDAV